MPPAVQRRSLARSNAHFERASRALPLGVSSNFRYWGEDKTIYIDHGRGGRITDIDGNLPQGLYGQEFRNSTQ